MEERGEVAVALVLPCVLEQGQPIRFGADDERGVRQRSDGTVELCDVAETGEDGLLVHDETLEDPSLAFALSRLSHAPVGPTPIGIFRAVERPVYDVLMEQQLEHARKDKGDGDLAALLHAGDTWTIS